MEATLPEDRAEVIEALSGVSLAISDFWQARAAGVYAGETLSLIKIGRNDPCPCGSGRKYKRCCGAAKPVDG